MAPRVGRRAVAVVVGALLVAFTIFHVQSSHSPPIVSQWIPSPYSKARNNVSCPSTNPNVPLPPINHKAQHCKPIPSLLRQFSLQLCYQPNLCNAFTLRIRRTNPAACLKAESSPDPNVEPEINRWMKEDRGPDAFEIRTDGAERTAQVYSTYEGDCTYSFDVQLRNAGDVYLQAWWTYENYLAFSETNHACPTQLWTRLSEPIHLNICSPTCPVQKPSYKPSPGYIEFPSSHAKSHNVADLPACTGLGPIGGSYLPMHDFDVIYPTHPLPREANGWPIAGNYRFVPWGCRWTHSGVRFGGEPLRCQEKNQKVLFVGDSHARVAWDTTVHRLKGEQGYLAESEKGGHKRAELGNLKMEFIWDPSGDQTNRMENCHRFKDLQALVYSIGAHPATKGTLANYLDIVVSYFEWASTCPDQPAHKIFMSAPAQPPRQDDWPKQFNDRRTNLRLAAFRDAAVSEAKRFGWAVIDAYDLTLPYALEPLKTDFAHYLATDVIDPIVDEIVGKMEVCPTLSGL